MNYSFIVFHCARCARCRYDMAKSKDWAAVLGRTIDWRYLVLDEGCGCWSCCACCACCTPALLMHALLTPVLPAPSPGICRRNEPLPRARHSPRGRSRLGRFCHPSNPKSAQALFARCTPCRHRIKNEETQLAAAMRLIHRQHTLLLTGTPLQVRPRCSAACDLALRCCPAAQAVCWGVGQGWGGDLPLAPASASLLRCPDFGVCVCNLDPLPCLQNDLHELYALLSYLYPDLFTTSCPFDNAFCLKEHKVGPLQAVSSAPLCPALALLQLVAGLCWCCHHGSLPGCAGTAQEDSLLVTMCSVVAACGLPSLPFKQLPPGHEYHWLVNLTLPCVALLADISSGQTPHLSGRAAAPLAAGGHGPAGGGPPHAGPVLPAPPQARGRAQLASFGGDAHLLPPQRHADILGKF